MGRRPRPLDPTASAAALFGAKLRKCREDAGWTQDQFGDKVFCAGDQISKIELAKRAPSWRNAVAFDRFFGTGEQFQELWHLVNKEVLPTWFRPYPELEAEATSIRTFGLALVPGLLQTEDYAREIFRTGQMPEDREQLLATRMKRQEVLDRISPPRLWVVLDERALRHPIGGRSVMREQIAHLIRCAERPDITIQIVPAGRGAYLGLLGSVTLLSIENGMDAAYVEGQAGGQVIEDVTTLKNCEIRFEMIRSSALSQEESLELLKEITENS